MFCWYNRNVYSVNHVGSGLMIFTSFLSILTFVVSFGVYTCGYREHMMNHSCLVQILMVLLLKQRPQRKPPWNQYIRYGIFHYQKNVTSWFQMEKKSKSTIATRIMIRKYWYQIVQILEWFVEVSDFLMRCTNRRFSHEMLPNHRIRVRSNLEKDNNGFSNSLAGKTCLRKASLKSILLTYFLITYGDYIVIICFWKILYNDFVLSI